MYLSPSIYDWAEDPHVLPGGATTVDVIRGGGSHTFFRFGSGIGGFQNLAGRVGSGQEVFEISWVKSSRVGSSRVESSQEVFKSHGSDRVTAVGSNRTGSRGVRNLAGWVESGQEIFKSHGSGRVKSRSNRAG